MSGLSAAADWIGSWRVALRVSRREVRRHRARSMLVVAMLALPVFGATAIDTVIASAENLTVPEQVARELGGFDAHGFVADDHPVYQNTAVQPYYTDVNPADDGNEDTNEFPAQTAGMPAAVHAVLPNAELRSVSSGGEVFAHGPSGYAITSYTQADLRDPAFVGVYDLVAGRMPRTTTEIDVSPAAAGPLGVTIGGSITVPASSMADGRAATFTVVGEVRQPGNTGQSTLFALPSAPRAAGAAVDGYYIHQSGGVTWSQVERLNAAGIVVSSRQVVLDPPPASQVPYNTSILGQPQPVNVGVSGDDMVIVAIAVGIALLEVVMLAGPAFAVSARRREREYAMLGAAGADATHLRRLVLADGAVLGAVAGVLGAGLGIAAAAAALPFVPAYNGIQSGALRPDAWRVLGVALLAIVLGLCAAYVPARSVARRDIAATLSGRRSAVGSRRTRRGRLALGLGLAAVGLCALYLCRQVGGDGMTAVCAVAGVALVEVGGILCTPTIVTAAAGLGRFLPLGPRLALRDSARHTGRTTPAVAAMFAAVAGAVAAGSWLDASLALQQSAYQPTLLRDQVAVSAVTGPQQAAQLTARLKTLMPVTGSLLTRSVDGGSMPGDATDSWSVGLVPPGVAAGQDCPQYGFVLTYANANASEAECGDVAPGAATAQFVIGGEQVLREITGVHDPEPEAVLGQGGIVVFSPGIVQNGKATLDVQHTYTTRKDPHKKQQSTHTVTIPAAYVPPDGIPDPGFVLAPSAAHTLGLDGGTGGQVTLLLDLRAPATADQLYAGDQVLQSFGLQEPLLKDIGLRSPLGLANLIVLAVALLVAIGAAAIATGLALADGRRDQETISAVGGSPWTRRLLAASTALVITGLGVLIGIPVGLAVAEGLVRAGGPGELVPPLAMAGASNARMGFRVPWLDLGTLAVAVPLLTGLGALLLSRSRPSGSGRTAG